MRVLRLFHISLWTIVGVAQGMTHDSPNTKHRVRSGTTRKFVIEVESDDHIEPLTRRLRVKSSHNGTYHQQFDCSDIFSGISLHTETDNVDSLLQMEGVKNVWPVNTLHKPWVSKAAHFSASAKLNYSMHQWTNVDKLHAQGIRGQGATVAIIDTGIDYTHKALGGCFGPGCKVVGGYDLVGATWDPFVEKIFPKKPDSDPMDHEGHGTHVAGIIAADNEWLKGVAPDARLLIYKVFSDSPWNTDEETVIQAFCDAYHAGADVISASLGEANGFSDNPWAVVASRIVKKGIVVVASAGNDGESGPFFASDGSSGKGVLAVAAVNVTGKPYVNHSDPRYTPRPGYFTSWGPTNELLMKPEIAAPGWEILSTVLDQGYAELSGTSMSAPYIAGVAALFIGHNGGRDIYGPDFAKMLYRRISSSGHSLPWVGTSLMRNFTAPPWQVGTGLIDAWKVIHYSTDLDYQPFAVMDKDHFKSRWKFSITNTGLTEKLYSFRIEPAAGVNIMDNYFGIASLFGLEPRRIKPFVELPESTIVRPGETKEMRLKFGQPKVDEDLLPLYSGKIWVESNQGERLSIPYGGAAYDTEKAFSRMFVDNPFVPNFKGTWAWSFNVEKDPTDYMEIMTTLSYPCFNLRWDIFEEWWSENLWNYPPVPGNYGYVGSATTMRNADDYYFYNPDVNDKDDTISFPLTRQSRGFQTYWWFGKLANGTQIAPGNYTLRFAALRPYGNPHFSQDWDYMYMPVRNIEVLPYHSTSKNASNTTHSYFEWKRDRGQARGLSSHRQ